jgi:hypothetical protein
MDGAFCDRIRRLRMHESHFIRCIVLFLGYVIFAHMYEFKTVSCFFTMLGVPVTECFASFRLANCS